MAELVIRKAERAKAKIKLGLSGVAGSGKTYSALLIAFGLCGNWDKIAVIDSDGKAANLYSGLPKSMGAGDSCYHVVEITEDYSPEQYIKAIEMCEAAGFEVIIIDSITHEWHYILELVDKAGGRSTDWVQPSARHKEFVKKIINASTHVITTVRQVTDWAYEKNEKGKVVPQKVGLKDETKPAFEYELTLNFRIDSMHYAIPTKDRTQLFMPDEKEPKAFVISLKTGQMIRDWCEKGIDVNEERKKAIAATATCENGDELGVLYDSHELFHADKDFIEALKLRSIVCVDNYNNGEEILKGWRGLPIIKNDADVKKAFRRRCIEVAYLYDTVDSLKSFWETICGKADEEPPMKFMKEDKGFIDAVTAAKEIILAKPAKNPFADTAEPEKKKIETTGDGTKNDPIKKKYERKKKVE